MTVLSCTDKNKPQIPAWLDYSSAFTNFSFSMQTICFNEMCLITRSSASCSNVLTELRYVCYVIYPIYYLPFYMRINCNLVSMWTGHDFIKHMIFKQLILITNIKPCESQSELRMIGWIWYFKCIFWPSPTHCMANLYY